MPRGAARERAWRPRSRLGLRAAGGCSVSQAGGLTAPPAGGLPVPHADGLSAPHAGGPRLELKGAPDVGRAGRPIEVELGDRRPGPLEDRGARQTERFGRDAGDQLGLVVAALPGTLGVDRHRDKHVATGGDPGPAPGDRLAERHG